MARAATSQTAFEINAPRRPQRAEPPEAEGGRGRKKCVYTASLSVIPRNLVFHAGLKGGLVAETHVAIWCLHMCVMQRWQVTKWRYFATVLAVSLSRYLFF